MLSALTAPNRLPKECGRHSTQRLGGLQAGEVAGLGGGPAVGFDEGAEVQDVLAADAGPAHAAAAQAGFDEGFASGFDGAAADGEAAGAEAGVGHAGAVVVKILALFPGFGASGARHAVGLEGVVDGPHDALGAVVVIEP